MTTLQVAATKRRKGDKRPGMRAFRTVRWLARTPKDALRIALALRGNGWGITAFRKVETPECV